MDNGIQHIILLLSISIINIVMFLAVLYLAEIPLTKNRLTRKIKRNKNTSTTTITSPRKILQAKKIENELTRESKSTFKEK